MTTEQLPCFIDRKVPSLIFPKKFASSALDKNPFVNVQEKYSCTYTCKVQTDHLIWTKKNE